MSQIITYKVLSLNCLKEKGSKSNVVERVNFSLELYDSIYDLKSYMPSTLELTTVVDESNFIDYENLTEQEVINWIESNITEDHKNNLISACNARIKDLREKVTLQLPWENN